jgi:OmpA-OmpF porin, OOP family
MRKFLLAAVAAAAIASPAAARDGSGYVGVDLGAMLAEDTKLDFDDDVIFINNAVAPDYGLGFDIGLVGGYDFGMVRAEVDLAYKRAGVDEVVLGQGVCSTPQNCILDADGDGSVLSAMANLILDFGDNDGLSGFIGAGAGMSRVSIDTDFNGTFPTIPSTNFGFDDEDSAVAWQLIAGFRVPVSQNIDAGVKYRFFNTRELEFSDGVDRLSGHWRSHSLLASITYNFYSPPPPAPPPPPPPPPPPATQTCPDGSVILATEACPVPPPPPPPPPPAPERG